MRGIGIPTGQRRTGIDGSCDCSLDHGRSIPLLRWKSARVAAPRRRKSNCSNSGGYVYAGMIAASRRGPGASDCRRRWLPRRVRPRRRRLFQDVVNIGQYGGTLGGRLLPAPPCNGIRGQLRAQDAALTKGNGHGTTSRVFRYSRVDPGPAGNTARSPRAATWHRAQSEAADRGVAQEADRESNSAAGSCTPSREPPIGQ
jgi:hypothetical protein